MQTVLGLVLILYTAQWTVPPVLSVSYTVFPLQVLETVLVQQGTCAYIVTFIL